MARITANDAVQLASVSDNERIQILYRYLVKKQDQKTIAGEVYHNYDDWASMSISLVTRGYGFHGGRSRGKYPRVPIEAIRDFVWEYRAENYDGGLDEGTFDIFLKEWYERGESNDDSFNSPPQSTQRVETPRAAPRASVSSAGGGFSAAGGTGGGSYGGSSGGGSSYRRTTYSASGRRSLRISPILVLIVIAALLWGGGKLLDLGRGAIAGGKNALSKVNSYLAVEYNAEVFEYEGIDYIGNQRFNKPDGVCMQVQGRSYTLGYFDGGTVEGFGVVTKDDAYQIDMGVFKKSLLTGFGVHRCGDVTYVGVFKKGVPDGVGYRYCNGTEQIVKFKSVDKGSISFEDELKVIAEKKGDKWYKVNGKELELKENTYKGLTFPEDGTVQMDGISISLKIDGSILYNSEEAELTWTPTSCCYDSILEDGEGTSLRYTHDGALAGVVEGEHRFKKKDGIHWQTFSTDIVLS